MDTVSLLEELANNTHHINMDHVTAQSNTILQAMHANNVNAVQQQFGDIGYLAHADEVVSY
jgi:hypothetical protein